MKNNEIKFSQKLTESSLLIAFATVLSIFKLIDLPYGGYITLASMLPLIIIAYRYNFLWAMLSGLVFGLIQLLIGINVLSYATSIVAAIAIVFIDYILAFMTISLASLFKRCKSQVTAFALGSTFVCMIRYLLHVLSGATVWAGLSIPTKNAVIYSFAYNATYMIPETIITVVAAVAISNALDFSKSKLTGYKVQTNKNKFKWIDILICIVAVVAVVIVSVLVFPNLQNSETGEFDITGIMNINLPICIVTVVCALAVIAFLIVKKILLKKKVS